MFDKIQEMLVRPLSSFEIDKLLKWTKEEKYTEEEIINAYDYCGNKPINYISTYMDNQRLKIKDKPFWLDKKIEDRLLYPEEVIEMQNLLYEFYKDKNEWEETTKKMVEESKQYWKNKKEGIK